MRSAALAVLLAFAASAQDKPEKIAIFVSGLDEAVPVVSSLTKLMSASKPFKAVSQKDPSKLIIVVSCMDRKESEVPFVCMYVSHYNGAAFKTFLGGGIFVAKDADTIASRFLGSIAQDIVERYNDTDKTNLKEALEACLFLTDSKCNVPDPLQKDLNAKQLTLGQYFFNKEHKSIQ